MKIFIFELYIVIINYFLKIHVALYIPSCPREIFKENVVFSDRRSVNVTVTDKISISNPASRYNGKLTNQNLE